MSYYPDKIKQIIPVPEEFMIVYKNEDTGEYEDWSAVGTMGYLMLKDGHDENRYGDNDGFSGDGLVFGWINEEGYGLEELNFFDECKLIRSFHCPKCRNKMTVLPFKNYSEAVYRCVICGENYPVKL